jgi:D,D-heptose 1,7-bisphosphate phosphatase
MPRPAAFLDRDGTLIHDPGYLGDPAGVILLDGSVAALAALRRAGYLLVVISNQSGVARGFYDEAAVAAVNARMQELLIAGDPDARLDAIYYCPHGPEASCDCRKPLPGLFLRAARELDLDCAASLAIGDHPRDVQAAQSAGIGRCLQLGASPHPPSLLAATTLLLAPARVC